MTAMEYGGPDRRRGGPDRRAAGEVTRILVVDDHALFRVGIANIARLTRIPSRRSICGLNNPTVSPAAAMPMVVALTAKPMDAGVT